MFDYNAMKEYIKKSGYKQRVIAEKAGINEGSLSRILQGEQKCEVNVFLNLCKAIGKQPSDFTKQP